jgi:hypothetical protein
MQMRKDMAGADANHSIYIIEIEAGLWYRRVQIVVTTHYN